MTAENNKAIKVKFTFSIFYILIYPVLILFLSGNWFWLEGWIFGIWFVISTMTNLIYLYLKDPALLSERFNIRGGKNQKSWDKYFIYALILLYLAWFIIMPLDAERFKWTASFPLWLKVFGGIELLISSFLLFRAFADNPFLSPVVRIQAERKQYVVSTGVYGFVRHPMYLGAMLMFGGVPTLLGSIYGILIGNLLSFLLSVRIIGEEKMLTEELEGYKDYKNKVKYRLIPFIW